LNYVGSTLTKYLPWLAASPDGIVIDFSGASDGKRCLKIKCPFVCEKKTISDACRNISGFCVTVERGKN